MSRTVGALCPRHGAGCSFGSLLGSLKGVSVAHWGLAGTNSVPTLYSEGQRLVKTESVTRGQYTWGLRSSWVGKGNQMTPWTSICCKALTQVENFGWPLAVVQSRAAQTARTMALCVVHQGSSVMRRIVSISVSVNDQPPQ